MVLSWIKNTYNQVLALASLKNKQRQFSWLLTFFIWLVSLIKPYGNESLYLFFLGLAPLIIGFVYPSFFNFLLVVWLFIGKLLGEFTSTLILFLIYFFAFVPITFLNRIFKKQTEISGWIKRENSAIDYKKLY